MKRHKCGLKSVTLHHPLKLTAFIDHAFKAQFEEATGLALRGSVAVLSEDNTGLGEGKPQGNSGMANLVDFTVRRHRRVVRSTFSAELNGLIDSIWQMFLLQCILHRIYHGIA